MSSELKVSSSGAPVVSATGLTKTYASYGNPAERLIELITNRQRAGKAAFTALHDVSFSLHRGEVLGIVGVNGAGKSTLLQLIAGTVTPSAGSVSTSGRIAAILELGSGFNPEFSGRENIYLNAATLGLDADTIDKKISAIIEFSGIGSHIAKPVKTYSSGMLVRLAFAIATSVEPDILIVDEALSVGDGAFRRRSFDRIMEIQRSGAAILFCSHSLYQVESFCDRAIWLHDGALRKIGPASEVVRAYQDFLDKPEDSVRGHFDGHDEETPGDVLHNSEASSGAGAEASSTGEAQFVSVDVRLDGQSGDELSGISGHACLEVDIVFRSDTRLAPPTAAVAISTENGRLVGSSLSHTHGTRFSIDADGVGRCKFALKNLPLNQGRYRIGVYLFCENGIHGYAMIDPVKYIHIHHPGNETGLIVFNGQWESAATG